MFLLSNEPNMVFWCSYNIHQYAQQQYKSQIWSEGFDLIIVCPTILEYNENIDITKRSTDTTVWIYSG